MAPHRLHYRDPRFLYRKVPDGHFERVNLNNRYLFYSYSIPPSSRHPELSRDRDSHTQYFHCLWLYLKQSIHPYPHDCYLRLPRPGLSEQDVVPLARFRPASGTRRRSARPAHISNSKFFHSINVIFPESVLIRKR